MKIEDKINKVLESFLLKDMQKVLQNVPLCVKLSVDAKIDNALIEVKQ